MDRIKSRLVQLTAAWVAGAMVLMILYWVITRSLEELLTAVAAIALCLVMFGIILLSRKGHLRLSAWLLTGLLFALVLASSGGYGLGSLGLTAFVLPILLAALTLGHLAGYLVTGLATLSVWAIGLATSAGWFQPLIPYQVSDLTFNAPFFTLLYLLVAGLAGEYARHAENNHP